jgi:glycosyltransferase involved in cell wall biosynthesis
MVSVVIPTKGRPVLLLRAAASVLAQSVSDLELIVVIDGEDALTEDALRRIEDPRLRVETNAISVGSGQARNIGAARATAPWLAFLDDDDEWLPEKLERQLALAASPQDAVLISCRSAYMTPAGSSTRPRQVYDDSRPVDEWLFDRRSLFGGQSFIQTSSFLLPTALFKQVQFPDHGQHEDWELVLLAVKQHGARLLTAPEILVRHYAEERRASLSASGSIERSLAWVHGVRALVTPRAFSGFCLTILAHRAKHDGSWREFYMLLDTAFRYGRPTILQLAIYLMIWGLPGSLHLALRRLRPAPIRRATPV